jgi:hypothetical protein
VLANWHAVTPGPAGEPSTTVLAGLKQPTATHRFDRRRRHSRPVPTTTTTSAPAPGQIVVLVANAARVQGAAGRLTANLADDGYKTLPPTNATTTVSATTIYYESGFQVAAKELAGTLHLSASSIQELSSNGPSIPVPDITGANLVVVLGPDLAG